MKIKPHSLTIKVPEGGFRSDAIEEPFNKLKNFLHFCAVERWNHQCQKKKTLHKSVRCGSTTIIFPVLGR